MRVAATAYEFIDNGLPVSWEQEVYGPPLPLPEGLLDSSRWEIPAKHRLVDLTEDRSNAEAFELWAKELLGPYDYWREHFADTEDSALDVQEHWDECNYGTVAEVFAHRVALLQPYWKSRMTYREIAGVATLSLHDVVFYLHSPSAAKHAEDYADLEEAMLDGALQRESATALGARFNTDRKMVKKIARRHGLPMNPAHRPRRATPTPEVIERIFAMVDGGMSARAVAREIPEVGRDTVWRLLKNRANAAENVAA